MPDYLAPGYLDERWTVLLVISGGAGLTGLAGLVFPRLFQNGLAVASRALLVNLLGILYLLACLTWVQSSCHGFTGLLVQLGTVGGGLLGLRTLVPWPTPGRVAPAAAGTLLPSVTLVVLGSGLGVQLIYDLDQRASVVFDTRQLPLVDLEAVPDGLAHTDAGTPIPVFTNRCTHTATAGEETAFLRDQQLLGATIRTGPADRNSNCHGWVFTGGRYHLAGNSVDVILRENCYQRTERPQAGDVIIYRNDEGGIAHTGLVRAVGTHGWLLIESKWAMWGRYLHEAAAAQCYAEQYEFYHTSRPSHLLAGLEGPQAGGSHPPVNAWPGGAGQGRAGPAASLPTIGP